jgi:hypothetical protein
VSRSAERRGLYHGKARHRIRKIASPEIGLPRHEGAGWPGAKEQSAIMLT